MRRARRETSAGGKAEGGRKMRAPVAVEARQGVEVRGGGGGGGDRDGGEEGSGGGLQLAAPPRKKSFWASKLGRQPRDVLAQRVLAEARQQEGKEQVQQLQPWQHQQQHEGLFVWVVGSTTNVYEMGKLVNLLPDGKFEVAMVESGETRSIARRLLFPASEKDPLETSDLTQLDVINEANLLWALQKRTEADLPYSFIGPVLVAVNPLMAIPDPEGVEAGATSMPHVPHPYTLAERMLLQLELSQLQGHPRSQSVIISGESGSGKTVTAKMVLQHVVRRSFPSRDSTTQSIHSDCPLDERLLQANPILEAFGNASTLRNDNSSRFGKFFKLFFDEDGNVDGATLETYLLERSRVTRHVHGERNFHIFYALLAGDASHMGVDEAFCEKLGLFDRDFNYAKMRNGARSAALLAKDLETLEHVMRAFSSIGIADDASERILETLAGLLHLGNLVFIDEGSTYDGEQAELIADSDALVHLCALWGLASHAEASRLLCERSINVGRETTRVPLSVEQAQKARDAVAKDVYARLFQWICARVNQSLEGPASVASFTDMPFVGVLDIFGFESFEQNGLEQLLINYANERLQASFNMHVLQDEADLYMREGLVSAGSYSRARGFSESPRRGLRAGSNSPAVPRVSAAASDVIEEVLELLDEEAQRLDGSDLGLNRRIQDQLASNKSLRTPHPSRRAEQFIIAHTAGHVTYTVGTFLERNDDVLPKETLDVLRRVDNQVLAEAFTDARSHAHARSSKSRHKTGARNAGKQLSVSGKFVCQIEDLVESLDATSCSYVRCIKPNPIMRRDDPEKDIPTPTAKKRRSGKKAKSAGNAAPSFPWFDRRYVSAQIKSLCLPQAALTLRDGLPIRFQLDELMSILDPAIQGPVERACHSHGLGRMTRFLPVMLGAFGVESSAYRLGATQVFFHNDQVDQLQTALRRIDNWVGDDSQFADDGDYLQWSEEVERSLIRQRWRIVIAAVRFFNKFNLPLMERENREQAALLLQRNLRALIKRRHLLRLRKAAITGQRLYRGAKGRERALDRIAEVEANEALLEEAAIADQEMSSDLEDENDGPRVNAGSTSGNSLHSRSQPRGSFHSRSQSGGSFHSRSHSGGSSAAASYSSSLFGRKRLSQSQGPHLVTDEPTPARTLAAGIDSALHRRSSSARSSATTERSSRRSSRSLISTRINESPAGPARFERVRKMSMIGAHFDENAFSRALVEAQEEDERREENLSRSYTQDSSLKEPPRGPQLAERPRSIVRASLKSAPQTGASGDVLDATAETDEESLSCVACVLGIVKRAPWKRRYLVLNPSARSVSIYAQRKGQAKLNSCINVFRVLPADFNPPPRMDASHDEYEMDNFEFEAPSTPITLLRSRARPGRYRLRVTGGRADHDALQETRTLTIAFDHFDEMNAWRNVFTKLLEPPSQNSGFKHDRVLLENAMWSALHEDGFSDAGSSLYQESTIFGAQIRCKNPECQQVNNSLYGMACIACGWSLSLHDSEDAADNFSGDASEDDLDSLPPSISMQRRPVRTNRWLQMGDGAASDDDDDSFF